MSGETESNVSGPCVVGTRRSSRACRSCSTAVGHRESDRDSPPSRDGPAGSESLACSHGVHAALGPGRSRTSCRSADCARCCSLDFRRDDVFLGRPVGVRGTPPRRACGPHEYGGDHDRLDVRSCSPIGFCAGRSRLHACPSERCCVRARARTPRTSLPNRQPEASVPSSEEVYSVR